MPATLEVTTSAGLITMQQMPEEDSVLSERLHIQTHHYSRKRFKPSPHRQLGLNNLQARKRPIFRRNVISSVAFVLL